MSVTDPVLRKAPTRLVTPLGDQVITRRSFDLMRARVTEHIEISHPRDLMHVAFTRQALLAQAAHARLARRRPGDLP